jgi:hypothetical protein
VIGYPLVISEKIVEHETVFKSTLLAADSCYVIALDLIAEIVHNILKGIDLKSRFGVIFHESIDGHTGDVADGLLQDLKF